MRPWYLGVCRVASPYMVQEFSVKHPVCQGKGQRSGYMISQSETGIESEMALEKKARANVYQLLL